MYYKVYLHELSCMHSSVHFSSLFIEHLLFCILAHTKVHLNRKYCVKQGVKLYSDAEKTLWREAVKKTNARIRYQRMMLKKVYSATDVVVQFSKLYISNHNSANKQYCTDMTTESESSELGQESNGCDVMSL